MPVAAQYGYHFGRNKVAYERFQWHRMQTEHFDVYHYPEARELSEMGAAMAEAQVRELESRFAMTLGGRTPLIFYSSNIHFKQTNTTPGFIPDGVGGFFEFLKGRVVLPANGNLHQFRRVIRHELVHVFTYAKLTRVFIDHRVPPDRFLPLWFTEGLAEYWSGPRDHQHEMMLRDGLASGSFVPLENIDRITGSYQMYKQGEAICHFLSQTYGEETILALIENAWRDVDFRKVMEHVTGERYETISERFTAWVKGDIYPRLETAELATVVAEGVGVEGFSAKPVAWTRPDGRREVVFVGNRSGYSNLYRVPVDAQYRPTGRAEVLVRGERSDRFEAFHLFESAMSVTRDGRLAFVTKSGETDVVHVYDLVRRRTTATYRVPSLVAIYSPEWSPDGTRLAFTGIERSGFADLFVLDPARVDGGDATTAVERVTHDAYDDRDPAWTADGQGLVFSSDRGPDGARGHYTLHAFDLATRATTALTDGAVMDVAPSVSPDGRTLAFVRAAQGADGRYSGQDVWTLDLTAALPGRTATAEIGGAADEIARDPASAPRPLVRVTAAAHDPTWTSDGALLFGSFEAYRFTVRALTDVDRRLRRAPADSGVARPPSVALRADVIAGAALSEPVAAGHDDGAQPGAWRFARYVTPGDSTARSVPYRRRYSLDLAQGGVSQSPILGTSSGAQVLFSDLLGDDLWYLALYNTGEGQDGFLRNLNVAVTRLQQGRRATIGYGLFRYAGLRYDPTDPDAVGEFPYVYETLWGGSGVVAYPISMFQRVEVGASLAASDKELPTTSVAQRTLLGSTSMGLVHDNSLWGMNGPIEGTRASATLGYTTDLSLRENLTYWTGIVDARKYWRLSRNITFAQWGMVRANVGRRARFNLIGGSWDLRGQRFLGVRGAKMWFTSQELRFPILYAPSAYVPVLAPFGIAGLRGALFADAAHVWNKGYTVEEPNLRTGTTHGALGAGLRVNLFGAIVLRYDVGWRYRDAFRTRVGPFRQFFFGLDF